MPNFSDLNPEQQRKVKEIADGFNEPLIPKIGEAAGRAGHQLFRDYVGLLDHVAGYVKQGIDWVSDFWGKINEYPFQDEQVHDEVKQMDPVDRGQGQNFTGDETGKVAPGNSQLPHEMAGDPRAPRARAPGGESFMSSAPSMMDTAGPTHNIERLHAQPNIERLHAQPNIERLHAQPNAQEMHINTETGFNSEDFFAGMEGLPRTSFDEQDGNLVINDHKFERSELGSIPDNWIMQIARDAGVNAGSIADARVLLTRKVDGERSRHTPGRRMSDMMRESYGTPAPARSTGSILD